MICFFRVCVKSTAVFIAVYIVWNDVNLLTLQHPVLPRNVYSDSEIPSARTNRPSVTIELTHLNER